MLLTLASVAKGYLLGSRAETARENIGLQYHTEPPTYESESRRLYLSGTYPSGRTEETQPLI
jgi:hypothetical protein